MTDISIERMRLEHLPAVSWIERLSFATPWPVEAYRHEIETNPHAVYFVARSRGARHGLARAPSSPALDVVGYAGLWIQHDEAHVSTIAVLPEWRRRHIGDVLLVRLIEHSMRRRMQLVTLEVRASNLVGQHLYAKYGFREVGRRRGYYSDNAEDAVLMSTPPLSDEGWRTLFDERRRALDVRGTPGAGSGDGVRRRRR